MLDVNDFDGAKQKIFPGHGKIHFELKIHFIILYSWVLRTVSLSLDSLVDLVDSLSL